MSLQSAGSADTLGPTLPRSAPTRFRGVALCALLLAAAGIPLSLLWDFSWESTVGIDLFWSPPHTANYLAVALAGLSALWWLANYSQAAESVGVHLWQLQAPLGAWLTLWGAVAFLGAVLFDRWWQSAYGLGAGIWHPPQICKAVAFFAILAGAWLLCLHQQNQLSGKGGSVAAAFAFGGGLLLAMITVVTLVGSYPNRQHSAWFYLVACGTYPAVLVALATAGRVRFAATVGAGAYMIVICAMVWLLPLFPATPQIGPIYNRLDHLLPPPFPLLLVVPAAALDWLFRNFSWPENRLGPWLQAGTAGFLVSLLIIGTQWVFSEFLLTNQADTWCFAGGGRHWPFFLKIAPAARQTFWQTPVDELNGTSTLAAIGLGLVAARIGLWVGRWMQRLRR